MPFLLRSFKVPGIGHRKIIDARYRVFAFQDIWAGLLGDSISGKLTLHMLMYARKADPSDKEKTIRKTIDTVSAAVYIIIADTVSAPRQ